MEDCCSTGPICLFLGVLCVFILLWSHELDKKERRTYSSHPAFDEDIVDGYCTFVDSDEVMDNVPLAHEDPIENLLVPTSSPSTTTEILFTESSSSPTTNTPFRLRTPYPTDIQIPRYEYANPFLKPRKKPILEWCLNFSVNGNTRLHAVHYLFKEPTGRRTLCGLHHSFLLLK